MPILLPWERLYMCVCVCVDFPISQCSNISKNKKQCTHLYPCCKQSNAIKSLKSQTSLVPVNKNTKRKIF